MKTHLMSFMNIKKQMVINISVQCKDATKTFREILSIVKQYKYKINCDIELANNEHIQLQ